MEVEKESLYQEIVTYYSNQRDAKGQENLVSMLREIQELYGCIPSEKIPALADLFDVKEAVFLQIIKLYPSLKRSSYSHLITVCTGARCAAKSAGDILEAVQKEVGRGKNGAFKIVMKECLKECRTAPNMKIDEDIYREVKPEDIPDILRKYQ